MSNLKTLAAAVFLSMSLFCDTVLAWGREGHAAIALVAEGKLSPAAAREVQALLKADGAQSLAEVASWADEIRGTDASLPMHSVRIPLDHSGYDRRRDCKRDKCVVAALERNLQVLRNRCAPGGERVAALKFAVHFVGDIHQPLHASIDTGEMKVLFGRKQYTLHKFWDTVAIRRMKQSPASLAIALAKEADGLPSGGGPADWAIESRDIARDSIFAPIASAPKLADMPVLTEADLQAAQKTMRVRMAQAGVRLAATLNNAMTTDPQDCAPGAANGQPGSDASS